MAERIYLDHNASTPVRPEAAAEMVKVLAFEGNPSSVHQQGRRARAVIENARERIRGYVGAADADLVFTSGGTEANVLALRGLGRPRILVSAVEHASVLEAIPEMDLLPVDSRGIVHPNRLEERLLGDTRPALVAVMIANNETGVIQPISELAAIARDHGALFHTDAVQALGKLPLDFAALGVDSMALSAHKVGGPPGCGALIVRSGVGLVPQFRGGGQERGLRAGSENVVGVVGFAAALAANDMTDMERLRRLRDGMEGRLRAVAPDAVILAKDAPRLANTCCVALPGVPAERQVIALDLAGIAVSAGAACSSGKVTRSHVLAAMASGGDLAGNALAGEAREYARDLATCAIRVSLGWTTTADDVDRFVDAWATLLRGRRRRQAEAVALAG